MAEAECASRGALKGSIPFPRRREDEEEEAKEDDEEEADDEEDDEGEGVTEEVGAGGRLRVRTVAKAGRGLCFICSCSLLGCQEGERLLKREEEDEKEEEETEVRLKRGAIPEL